MKYHVISTSRSGHGAIFTNVKEAREYMSQHPNSVYTVLDTLPIRIPSIGSNTNPGQTSSPVPNDSDSPVTIYTDGSALGNPGPGGYGAVILKDGEILELSQGYRHTTNNRMEMLAVITALEALEATDRPIRLFSDSQYTLNGITKGWAKTWRRNSWKKSDGKPAKNPDLWERILNLVDTFPNLTFQWVRGHAGNRFNEAADTLASSAAQRSDLIEDTGYGDH